MRPDHKEFIDGLKLAAIAIASAGVTATLVIGVGRAVLEHPDRDAQAGRPSLMHTAAR